MVESLKELFQYRNMLYYYTRSELRSRYKGSMLGMFWALLNPLLLLVIYGFVFSLVMRVNIPGYFLFLFSGLLPWVFFRSAVLAGATLIPGNAGLIKKVYFPRVILPVSNVLSHLVNFIIGLIVLVPILIIFRHGIGLAFLVLPLVVIVELLLCTALSIFFSAVTVYLRDLRQVLELAMMAGFYFTPIVYKAEMVPEKFRIFYNLNPLKPIIESYQNIIYYKTMPHWTSLGIVAGISMLLLVVGYLLFQQLQRGFAEKV